MLACTQRAASPQPSSGSTDGEQVQTDSVKSATSSSSTAHPQQTAAYAEVTSDALPSFDEAFVLVNIKFGSLLRITWHPTCTPPQAALPHSVFHVK